MHPQCLSLEWHRSHGVVGGGVWKGGLLLDLGDQWEGLRHWRRWVRTGGEKQPGVGVGLW